MVWKGTLVRSVSQGLIRSDDIWVIVRLPVPMVLVSCAIRAQPQRYKFNFKGLVMALPILSMTRALLLPCALLLIATPSVAETRSEASARHQRECAAYCSSNSQCQKCSELPGCGLGLTSLKSWTGWGDNWYACRKTDYQLASEQNKATCLEQCAKNARCVMCSELPACGIGFEPIKSYGGAGKNWYSCQQVIPSLDSWPTNSIVTAEHRTLIVSAGGFAGSTEDDGLEWFCEDNFGKLSTKDPSILCIGRHGVPGDNSETVSKEIVRLADEMKRKSGKVPEIILIGKSMGGCKLHHAATGAENASDGPLRARPISLFVGVDMSCQVWRHWQYNQEVTFTPNVSRVFNFVETLDNAQTGYHAVREGATDAVAKAAGITTVVVTTQGYDVGTAKLTTQPLCSTADHGTIDDCAPLLKVILDLVKREAATK